MMTGCETCHRGRIATHTVHFSATIDDAAEDICYCCECYNKVAANFTTLTPCQEVG
jgi:hypothetical protein